MIIKVNVTHYTKTHGWYKEYFDIFDNFLVNYMCNLHKIAEDNDVCYSCRVNGLLFSKYLYGETCFRDAKQVKPKWFRESLRKELAKEMINAYNKET